MSLAILFHFLCAQHVSDINISIIRCLRIFCWITTLVVLFLVRCVLEFRCGWVGVVSALQAYQELANILLNYHIGRIVLGSMCDGTENKTSNVVIQQHSRKLLMMDMLMPEICWVHKKWNTFWEFNFSATNSTLTSLKSNCGFLGGKTNSLHKLRSRLNPSN